MKWIKKLFGSEATHEITDDSGFLAIIDPDAYKGFVHDDWTLEMLRQHFTGEMASRHLLLWGTGLKNTWKVRVSLEPAKVKGFREITGSIGSSKGRLLLTNYESLTMAAQFPETTLPQPHEENQLLQLKAGMYDCRILQLSDPESNAPSKESVSFVYEFTSATKPKEPWGHIPWSKR